MSVSEEVIQRASRGQRDAQQVIFETFRERIFRVVWRMVGESDADDVTQNTFMRVFEKLHQFRRDAAIETWMHRIAVNQALKHLKQRSRSPMALVNEEYRAAQDVSESSDNVELVALAMSKIDPELRLVLQLKEIDDLSYSQIAEIVEIPEGTVGSRLNRARKELREQLVTLGWES